MVEDDNNPYLNGTYAPCFENSDIRKVMDKSG